MSQYRDDLEAARLRIEALEADNVAQRGQLDEQEAELEALRDHVRHLEADQATSASASPATRRRFARRHFFTRSHGFVLAPILVGSTALIVFAVSPRAQHRERPTPFVMSEAVVSTVGHTADNVFASPEGSRSLSRVRELVKTCHREDQPEWGTVHITFNPDGTVEDTNVTGPTAGTEVGECVEEVVRSVRIPSFSGESAFIRLRFSAEGT